MSLIYLALYLILTLVIGGFILWVIESAPFISATVKPFIRWVAYVMIGLFCIAVLLQFFGVASPFGRVRI